jgi:hypothetical protein
MALLGASSATVVDVSPANAQLGDGGKRTRSQTTAPATPTSCSSGTR